MNNDDGQRVTADTVPYTPVVSVPTGRTATFLGLTAGGMAAVRFKTNPPEVVDIVAPAVLVAEDDTTQFISDENGGNKP